MDDLREAARMALTDDQIAQLLPRVRHNPGMVGYTCYSFGDVAHAVRAALASEPEESAEPVAVVHSLTFGGTGASIIPLGRARFDLPLGAKLYDAPPAKRKPLTDEQADDLAREMVKGKKSVNWLVRRIEHAHGITGD